RRSVDDEGAGRVAREGGRVLGRASGGRVGAGRNAVGRGVRRARRARGDEAPEGAARGGLGARQVPHVEGGGGIEEDGAQRRELSRGGGGRAGARRDEAAGGVRHAARRHRAAVVGR